MRLQCSRICAGPAPSAYAGHPGAAAVRLPPFNWLPISHPSSAQPFPAPRTCSSTLILAVGSSRLSFTGMGTRSISLASSSFSSCSRQSVHQAAGQNQQGSQVPNQATGRCCCCQQPVHCRCQRMWHSQRAAATSLHWLCNILVRGAVSLAPPCTYTRRLTTECHTNPEHELLGRLNTECHINRPPSSAPRGPPCT